MSMLPTNEHTSATVHEFISSVCAWHRRCNGDVSVAEYSLLLPQLVFGCWTVVGDGDAVLRLGLDDSNFMRFPPIGVDALLKSNGDDALVRLLFVAVANVWLIDGWAAAAAAATADADAKYGWLFSNEFAFCCSDNSWNVFGIFAGIGIRLCGDVFTFDGGDCCERNGFTWIGGVCRFVSRFCGPFKMCCLISLSFAAWAYRMHEDNKECIQTEVLQTIHNKNKWRSYSPEIAKAVNLSYRSTTEMQLAEMLKIMLISNCLLCLISGNLLRRKYLKYTLLIGKIPSFSSIQVQCDWNVRLAATETTKKEINSTLTGDGTDVLVRFRFSGDVMSLVIPVFMELILNLESNNELRTLFDLKWTEQCNHWIWNIRNKNIL